MSEALYGPQHKFVNFVLWSAAMVPDQELEPQKLSVVHQDSRSKTQTIFELLPSLTTQTSATFFILATKEASQREKIKKNIKDRSAKKKNHLKRR